MTTDRDDKLFDDLMGVARTQDILVPESLLDRVMADADTVLAAEAFVPAEVSEPKRSGLQVVLAILGGWGAISGLATATVAGLWIGVSPPAVLDTLAQNVWGSSAISVPLLETDTLFGLEG